jgi:hypothetical protein
VETDNPAAEVTPGIALLGRILARFDNIVDTFVPTTDGSADKCYISESYDPSRCVWRVGGRVRVKAGCQDGVCEELRMLRGVVSRAVPCRTVPCRRVPPGCVGQARAWRASAVLRVCVVLGW